MKKIVYSILATIAGLVLLFSYRTSLDASPTPSAALGSGSGSATTSSGSSGTSGSSGSSGSSGTSGSSASSGSSESESESSDSESSDSSSSGSSGSTNSSGSSSSGSSSNSLKDGTYTGQAADTPYGPVQVSIKVSGGRIASVDVPRYPDQGGRDQQINSYALPQLVQETVSAQSAQIDMVSGATFTSQGYEQSLQSALDQARA